MPNTREENYTQCIFDGNTFQHIDTTTPNFDLPPEETSINRVSDCLLWAIPFVFASDDGTCHFN
jgi:hypothetical protein